MSNKRDLKKTINYICESLFAECVAASLYGTTVNQEDIDAVFQAIIHLQNDYVHRISHPEPGIPQKQYYRNIVEDFNKQASEVIDQIQNLA